MSGVILWLRPSPTFSCMFPCRGVSLSVSTVTVSTVLRNRRCALKKRLSSKTVLEKTPRVLLALLFFVLALWAQKDQPPTKPSAPYKIPPEAAARVNPVKPSAESLAKGKKLYAIDCAMCHGKDGDGKGDMASDIKNVTGFYQSRRTEKPHRRRTLLHNPEWQGRGMPPEGDRAKDDDIWNMVNYIRSFAKK